MTTNEFDDEIVGEFLVESYENLDQLDQQLLALEDEPTSVPLLSGVFRTIHTIKGTCGFLGFGKLEALTHVGENLLSRLRDGELVLTPPMATALLRLSDATRSMLASIEATGDEGDADHRELAELLGRLASGDAAAEAAEDAGAEPSEDADAEPSTAVVAAPAVEPVPEPVVAPVVEPAPPPIVEAPAAAATEPAAEGTDHRSSVSESSVRVDVGLLDNLVTLVGELVLTRNQLVQKVEGTDDPVLAATAARLNLITSELQEDAMKTRMQPIGNVWSKFPRVVRDLAIACNRNVRIEMEGKDTELDKSIIEAIRDPLTHLVRNAVDHGIESPEDRRAAGKPEEGVLSIRAFHEGGQVIIEVVDDGAGIDPDKVRAKAVDKGLLSPERAAVAGERELFDLLFSAGFSTAAAVTNVSGRGVGMDVVRTNLERIGGSVDLVSTKGQGTTCRVKIPLTLAIIPALVVGSAGSRYAIPQVNLLELVRLDSAWGPGGIESIQGTPVYRLRGNLLPLVDLASELGTEPVLTPASDGPVLIVVLQADDRQFGLVVAAVHDSAEIVVKPLSQHLKSIETYAGSTIMGDGRVGLILDVMGLAQRAQVITEHRERSAADATAGDRDASTETLLVCATPDDGRMAIPLELVDRLEEMPWSSVESAGDHEVVQYRGEIMPLVHLSDILPERRQRARHRDTEIVAEDLQVVVHSSRDRRIGLVVDRVIDVVEQHLQLDHGSRRGVLGTAVIQGRVTEVLDLAQIVELARIELPTPVAVEA